MLADENIHPDVVVHLRKLGHDIVSVMENGMDGETDNIPTFGIIYLRPGHIRATFTIESLAVLMRQSLSVQPPFVVVVQRSGNQVRVRSREI